MTAATAQRAATIRSNRRSTERKRLEKVLYTLAQAGTAAELRRLVTEVERNRDPSPAHLLYVKDIAGECSEIEWAAHELHEWCRRAQSAANGTAT